MIQPMVKPEAQATTEPDPSVEVTRLQNELNAKALELDAFKARVLREAKRGKIEHDWCHEINRIVENLGLEWGEEKYSARVHMEFTLKASLSDGILSDDVNSDWVENSLAFHDQDDDYDDGYSIFSFRLDNDSTNAEISDVSIRVTNFQWQ